MKDTPRAVQEVAPRPPHLPAWPPRPPPGGRTPPRQQLDADLDATLSCQAETPNRAGRCQADPTLGGARRGAGIEDTPHRAVPTKTMLRESCRRLPRPPSSSSPEHLPRTAPQTTGPQLSHHHHPDGISPHPPLVVSCSKPASQAIWRGLLRHRPRGWDLASRLGGGPVAVCRSARQGVSGLLPRGRSGEAGGRAENGNRRACVYPSLRDARPRRQSIDVERSGWRVAGDQDARCREARVEGGVAWLRRAVAAGGQWWCSGGGCASAPAYASVMRPACRGWLGCPHGRAFVPNRHQRAGAGASVRSTIYLVGGGSRGTVCVDPALRAIRYGPSGGPSGDVPGRPVAIRHHWPGHRSRHARSESPTSRWPTGRAGPAWSDGRRPESAARGRPCANCRRDSGGHLPRQRSVARVSAGGPRCPAHARCPSAAARRVPLSEEVLFLFLSYCSDPAPTRPSAGRLCFFSSPR